MGRMDKLLRLAPRKKNKDQHCRLPDRDGTYQTRSQDNSGDRHEEIKNFSVIPRIEKGGYFGPGSDYEIHWEGETWEEGTPYAWKEI